MNPEPVIPQYGCWTISFPVSSEIDRVRFSSPSGKIETRPCFDHQPVIFQYDQHGYEEMTAAGPMVKMVRFFPKEVGRYRYQTLGGKGKIGEGEFLSGPSTSPGFVQISPKDPRYFAFSNGDVFCPTGLNLCGPAIYALPQSMEHFSVGNAKATLGLHEFRRWFRLLSQNGGNFTRIWLSNAYFETEQERAGEIDPIKFNRLDGIVELAREYGIRLKLCFDHFRAFSSPNPVTAAFFLKKLVNPLDARQPKDMDDWLSDPSWQDLWFKKVKAYLDRYGGDPVIMAWELWNEMDCVETSRWELVREWTRAMLLRIRAADPDHLVVNSLGSFDEVRKQVVQDDMKMDETDFQQVHRYLDQGAPWEICRLDPVAFSVDAIQRSRRPDRPVILAETGAVNDRHTGPFRYFRMDHRGIIFHDTTFPAFFAGGAGTGQNWFWDSYADTQDVWGQFRPFAELMTGVNLDQEGFEPADYSNPLAWCLALRGRATTLLWIRNRADTWDRVLRDEIEPELIHEVRLDLGDVLGKGADLKVFPLWPDLEKDASVSIEDGKLRIANLRYGVMVRLKNG